MDALAAVHDEVMRDGAAVAAGLVARPAIDAVLSAWEAEIRPFDGPLPRQRGQRNEPHSLDAAGRITNPVVNPRALAFPEFSATEIRLMRGGPVVALASALLGEPVALLHATVTDTKPRVALHRDLHPIWLGAPICALMIALEPIRPESGAVSYWAGSHRLPEHDPDVVAFDRACEASWRATYVDDRDPDGLPEAAVLQASLVMRYGLRMMQPSLAPGDALCWLGRTWHGSAVPTVADRRRSVIFHFVPLATVADRMGVS